MAADAKGGISIVCRPPRRRLPWFASRRRVRELDYRRIHELEHDLGLRDDAPEPQARTQTAANAAAVLKAAWSSALRDHALYGDTTDTRSAA